MPEIRRISNEGGNAGVADVRPSSPASHHGQHHVAERSRMTKGALKYAIKEERDALARYDGAVRNPAAPSEQILELKAAWDLAQERVEFVKSDLIIQRANELSLPLPETTDEPSWSRMQDGYGTRYLTRHGQTQLRRAVREEERLAREPMLMMGSMAVGILGVATGLISLILRLVGV